MKKNNFFLVTIYAVITFFAGIIIIFTVDSFDKTVSLKNFYSDESISFEVSGDYSEVLSNEAMKKIFTNNGDFMILKEEIRNNLSGIYISGNYKNYLNIFSGESLANEKYKNKAVATRGNGFWKFNDFEGKEFIEVEGTNYEIIGIHNFDETAWYEHRGIINLTDEHLFSEKFPIAGQYVLDGDNALQKFDEIKKIIEENTETLTVTRSENIKLYEILSFFADYLVIFIFIFLISCIFILNIINITRNWFLSKLKTLGIMRAFGATKKDITIFSIKTYLKQVFIGFPIGYLVFIISLLIKNTLLNYSLTVLLVTPVITLLLITLISMISLFVPLIKVLKISPLEVMKFYGK